MDFKILYAETRHGGPLWMGFTKFTQLHVVTSLSVMCALRAQSTAELEPDMQHITLASHTSLALALAQVEFELLEGVQQQNTSGQDIR